jgi:hypothetical protein
MRVACARVPVPCTGTNVKEAKALIEGSGYRMIMTDDLEDAAAKAVKIADIVRQVRHVHWSLFVHPDCLSAHGRHPPRVCCAAAAAGQ